MAFDSIGTRRTLEVGGAAFDYYSLAAAEAAGLGGLSRLPMTFKVVVENLLRRHAEGTAGDEEIASLRAWLADRSGDCEVSFLPARVLMPESSGINLLGDMTAMREAMVELGGDPAGINPVLPVDFIIDHSVNAHRWGTPDALLHNMKVEMHQNRERYAFLRWASKAYDNLRVFPPGAGILHQVNLEYLARVVWTREAGGRTLAYPDSLIAMDSHTAMINSMGVVGWGVGGLEGATVMLGEPVAMLLPEAVGVNLSGRMRPGVTATDLVLFITQRLRREGVLACFVEYLGEGVDSLSLPERSTVSNMTPEMGATMGYFPIDAETLRFLRLTGRPVRQVALVEAYARAQGLWRDADSPAPQYAREIELDLSDVEPCLAGPGRPDARVPLSQVPAAFGKAVPRPVSEDSTGAGHTLADGDVVIAAITSCTNTSNPAVLIGAGLLARNARRRGLARQPWVKATLSPGSRVVADYLAASGLQDDLNALGFHIVGFGCMSCMGNSGPLPEDTIEAIEARKLAVAAVLSGNRNFEARVHPAVRLNFLASPPLVVAHALAGTVRRDLEREPLGRDPEGRDVYLRDIWPDDAEIRAVIDATLTPAMFTARYATLQEGSPEWQALPAGSGVLFDWEPDSHFIVRPPYFEGMPRTAPPLEDIRGARILGLFGDMLTTDHISPIGTISPETPSGRYLQALGIAPSEFVTYAARRMNHRVLIRGTFANVRLRNEMTPDIEGSSTLHWPEGTPMTIYDAAMRYAEERVPLVVVAGREYGAGSSRDWAAKGTERLGIRAVIAESFERIHRSNLVGMGVLPLEFEDGMTRRTLGLEGDEVLDLQGIADGVKPRMRVSCSITRGDGSVQNISLRARIDSRAEAKYFCNGGIVKFALRRRLGYLDEPASGGSSPASRRSRCAS
ncbi:MAG: aconitate hydratase AcnA [Lautropia sp.]